VILVDTSIWIDHLRASDRTLTGLLWHGKVLAHPFVTGELALGNLNQRGPILNALQDLPQATVATNSEVLLFIEQEQLFGLGIGYIDAHLLAAVRLTPGAALWSREKRLHHAAEKLGIGMAVPHSN
jgi:predicted nucleic acid-binding protein